METDNHESLLEQVATQRSQEAFSKLFSFYAPKIYNYGLKHQLNESQSRELTQEVMTLVWTKAHLYNSAKGSALTWIFTVARNYRFDLIRKNLKHANTLSSEDVWTEGQEISALDSNYEIELSPDIKKLGKVVNELPQQQRDVITSVFLKGLTHEEYARESGLPLGTVKSRIRLALQKLNYLMEKK